jgi:prepilin-type N-terminal cleavage/methylation domain-containing protein
MKREYKYLGFTLIELLAVIVILAVIALIVTPLITSTIESSRQNSARISASNYSDAVDQYIMAEITKGYTTEDSTYDISYFDSIEISGQKPTAGSITIKNTQVDSYQLLFGNYIVTKTSGSDVTTAKKGNASDITVEQTVVYSGQYKYTYNAAKKGWSMILKDDQLDATTINSTMLKEIYGHPIVSMHSLFQTSKASTIDLSSFNTSNVTDMSYMFFGCINLTNVDLTKLNTSNVTDMSHMFAFGGTSPSDTKGLSNFDFSSFDTSNVTNMSSMLYGQSRMTTIDLSKIKTLNVTNMSGMFCGCNKLTTINFPSTFITTKVTNMSNMFSWCTSLTSLDLSKFSTTEVTDMSLMFSECYALKSIDLSSFDTSNVTNMSGMFSYCYALESLDLSKFKTVKANDMTNMFSSNFKLTSLDLSTFDMTLAISTMKNGYNYKTSKSENINGVNCIIYNIKNLTNVYVRSQAELDALNQYGYANTTTVISIK